MDDERLGDMVDWETLKDIAAGYDAIAPFFLTEDSRDDTKEGCYLRNNFADIKRCFGLGRTANVCPKGGRQFARYEALDNVRALYRFAMLRGLEQYADSASEPRL